MASNHKSKTHKKSKKISSKLNVKNNYLSRHRHLNIRRTVKCKKFVYLTSDGGQIENDEMIDRLNKLRIPPAYENVRIASNAKHHLQAIGVDTKGRKQYIYNEKFVQLRNDNKFKELIEFGKNITKIRKDNDHVNSKQKIIALVLYIMDKCLFRVGNQFYTKEYKTYGTTTLTAKHIKCKGNVIYIEFIGKKNVVNYCDLSNKYVVPLIKQLVKNAKTGYIFKYIDINGKYQIINAKDINDFVKKYSANLTAKMFRTWAANILFLQETINDLKKDPSILNDVDDAYVKTHVVKSLKVIAEKLHNTPTVSKKSYMNNDILNLYIEKPKLFYQALKSEKNKNITELFINLLQNLC